MAGEKTEQASPQRREKASREGDLLHSRELCSAAGTLAGVMLLGVAGPRFLAGWTTAMARFLSFGGSAAWEMETRDATLRSLMAISMTALAPVGLVGVGVAAAALGAGVLQTGGIQVHPQLVGLKLERINPLNNLKSLFSLRSMARLGKSMIPAAFLAVFAVQRVARQWNLPPFSSVRLIAVGGDAYDLLLAAAWLLFGWALIDYTVEWRSREQRLKMSRQDQRDEYKESEGNPQIRSRIRNLQRLARRKRMKADLSRAAVVITNPTHYAVALEFDFVAMDAPRVLAKGRNLMAEEIKQEARWAGVPILENPQLARSLYRLVEPGQSIPAELYAAVASILAFLYRQRVEQEIRERRERAARRAGPGQPTTAAGGPPGSGQAGGGQAGGGQASHSAPRAIIPGVRRPGHSTGPGPGKREPQPPASPPDTPPETPPGTPRGGDLP